MKPLLSFILFTLLAAGARAETIAQLRSFYTGTDTIVDAGVVITGVIISDITQGNIDVKELQLQDSTAGIFIRFTAAHNFLKGTKITVHLSGRQLILYNGWLQLYDIPVDSATAIGVGTVVPRRAAISEIVAHSFDWQSTLLQIPCAVIDGGGGPYFTGTHSMHDATGSLNLYTRTAASFANLTYPTDTIYLFGYLANFNAPEFRMRDFNDWNSGCIPYTPVISSIEETLREEPIKAEKYFDLLGHEISRDQCTICIGVSGNKARKVAVVR